MKRPALQNKRVAVLGMAFWALIVFGTFEKRAPGLNFWSLSQQAGGALDRHRRGQGSNLHLVLSRCCLSSARKFKFIQFFYRPYHLKQDKAVAACASPLSSSYRAHIKSAVSVTGPDVKVSGKSVCYNQFIYKMLCRKRALQSWLVWPGNN